MSSLLPRSASRVDVLTDRDRDALARLVDTDPVVNAVLASRLASHATLEPRAFGGTLLGVRAEAGRLGGAAFSGGNLLPVGGGPREWRVLAESVVGARRVCTSMVGRSDAVEHMWTVLRTRWGPPRAIRERQPLLQLDRSAALPAGDARVRRIRPDELGAYLPAAAAMFTEELGIAPDAIAAPADYRRRIAGLLESGRAFGVVDTDGTVLFKADLGAITPHTCQVQGVWVRPDRRGRGLAAAALAPVLRHALQLAPTVSLYVNDFNEPARRLYDRLGMRQVATLATILF